MIEKEVWHRQFLAGLCILGCIGCRNQDSSASSHRFVRNEPAVENLQKPDPEVQDDKLESTVAKLQSLKVRQVGLAGPGPAHAIVHNETTREVVAKGRPIIPVLLKRLETCSWDEAVFIVFCLNDLRAKSAKGQVSELQKAEHGGKRFRDPHDLTLELQIQHYLRDVDSW
jgi:hypothetical protein